MKLYGPLYSAFVARVRIGLAYKGLTYDRAALPPGGLAGAAFRAINPTGRVPVLVLDDGTVLVESETILAFLEESYPEPALLPSVPRARAAERTIGRLVDNYLTPATEALYPFRVAGRRDEAALQIAAGRVIASLALVDGFVDPERLVDGARLAWADCMVFPSLFLVELVAGQLGIANVFGQAHRISRYFETGKAHSLLGTIYAESVADLPAS
jgi:maleylacetoacetate isomerase